MGSVFDALLTASAGGSPRLRFSPGCPSASARVGAPESCKISHNDQALWGLFFFPRGKNSCPDHYLVEGAAGGQNTKPGASQGAIAAPALAPVIPTPKGAAPAPSIFLRGGESPGKRSPWELQKAQLQPSRRCSQTLPDDLLGL